MADPHRDSRIADDWLEVDETASVVSLSSFDDNELVASRPSSPLLVDPSRSQPHFRARSRSPSVSPPPSLSSLRLDDDSHQRPQSPELDPKPPSPSNIIAASDHATNSINATTSSLWKDEATPQCNTTDAELHPRSADDEGNARDPGFYYKALNEVTEAIISTSEQALQLGASRISTLSFLKSTCDELFKHAKELEPILATYVRRWNDGVAVLDQEDMPLNPALLDWISHLNSQLDNAQTEMDKIPLGWNKTHGEISTLKAESIPLHVNVALAGCAEALEDALTTIEDFMPIFKTDFDEAQTRRMNIPTKEVGEVNARPRREPPHPDVARIRRELYVLKDQLRKISALLSTLCAPIPPPSLSEAPYVTRRLESIIEAISTVLTNHASEWLESDLVPTSNRTISYHEFLDLEPEILHDIAGHLREFYEDLVVEKSDMVTDYTDEMIRNHQIVSLAECGQLMELASTAGLLETLVLPTRY